MPDNDNRDLARAVREAYLRTASSDDAARQRLLERLREAPPPVRPRAWWRRLAAPAGGSPLRVALVAAGLLVLVGAGLMTRDVGPSRTREVATQGPGPEEALVRFELRAPGATRVALVGDFNDWDPAATPMRREASVDAWSVSLPMSHGRHVYGFVVDHQHWLPDPGAPLAPGDGFGSPSSVIVVAGAGS